jgi:hypothetical protein
MTNKVNSRVLLKTGTTSDWDKAAQNNFKPLAGEVCIYLDRFKREENGDQIEVPGIKIGDGSSTIGELPFIGDEYITDEQINKIFESKILSENEVRL